MDRFCLWNLGDFARRGGWWAFVVEGIGAIIMSGSFRRRHVGDVAHLDVFLCSWFGFAEAPRDGMTRAGSPTMAWPSWRWGRGCRMWSSSHCAISGLIHLVGLRRFLLSQAIFGNAIYALDFLRLTTSSCRIY